MNTLDNYIAEYLEYCEYRKRLDPKSIKAYRIDLKQYLNFCYHSNDLYEPVTVVSPTLRAVMTLFSTEQIEAFSIVHSITGCVLSTVPFLDTDTLIVSVSPLSKLIVPCVIFTV